MRYLLLFALLAPLAAQAPSPGGEPVCRARIKTPTPAVLRQGLAALGYDVDCLHDPGAAGVEIIASTAEIQALRDAGFTPEVIEAAQPLAQKLGGAGRIPTGYHDLAAIQASLDATAAAYPNLAQVFDAAATFGPGTTYGGRPIKGIRISDNVAVNEDEPRVLINSCHHCREIVTPELVLDQISRLVTGYGSDPAITAIVDSYEIWLIPVVNPDGLDYVWTVNNMWRKNRTPQAGGQWGVDLNRNYLLGWAGGCGGSTNPASDTFRGPSAGSEAETQTIIGMSRALRFAKVLDFHSSGREVLLSYLCTPLPAPVQTLIDTGGTALAATNGYNPRQPSSEGEHQEWQIQEVTSYAYLVETETSFQPPYANALAEANLVWPLVLGFLQRDIPIAGHVTDSISGLPLEADVSVAGLSWSAGETRTSRADTGRYHLFLPAGSWTVTFSKPGYLPQTLSIAATTTGTTLADVQLTPLAQAFMLDLSTNPGAFDLHLALLNIPTGTTEGWLLLSFATTQPAGSGPLAGLWPDAVTWLGLTSPVAPGNPLHWSYPTGPGLFPAAAIDLPPNGVPFPPGTTLDALGVALQGGPGAFGLTQIVRLGF